MRIDNSKERLLTINALLIVAISIVYSFISFRDGKYGIVAMILGFGVGICAFILLTKKVLPQVARFYTISFAQFLIIFIVGASNGSLGDVLTLILASSIMSSIYFNKNIIIWQGLLINMLLIGCIALFYSTMFEQYSTSYLVKGIIGLDIGIIFNYLVVRWGEGFIKNANDRAAEAAEMLNEIKGIQQNISSTTEFSLQKAQLIAQQSSGILDNITEIHNDIEQEVIGAQRTNSEVEIVGSSVGETRQAATDMKQVLNVLHEIMSSNQKIINDITNQISTTSDTITSSSQMAAELQSSIATMSGILSKLSEITLQTRLLALNASVEAKHAGAAGKGFSVVANEVGGLSQISEQSTKQITAEVERLIKNIDENAKKSKQGINAITQTERSISALSDNFKQLTSAFGQLNTHITTSVDKILHIDDIFADVSKNMRFMLDASGLNKEKISEIVSAIRLQDDELSALATKIKELNEMKAH